MTRIKVFSLFLISMFLFLGLAIINLEVIHGKTYRDLSKRNCIRLLPKKATRGKIIDRRQETIVGNKLNYDVVILPRGSDNQSQEFKKISQILGISQEALKARYENNSFLSSLPVTLAKGIDISEAIAVEEAKLDLPGIVIQAEPVRHYPYASLASHILGHLGEIDHWRLTKLEDYGYKRKDIVGFGGIEEKYDYYLRGQDGGLSIEVDNRGRMMRILGFKPPINGKDLQLTIDLRFQKIIENKIDGKTGCVIILDPYTGEILALTSFPNFNPEVFRDNLSSAINYIFADIDAPLLNRAISATYPPGSMFKLVLASAALETKKIDLDKTYFCPGSMLIGRKEYKCWNKHGMQNIISAIANSCNVFFYNLGLLLGPQKIYDYALKFGLSKPTSIDLAYETGGFVPSPLWKKVHKFKKWFDGDTANLSIGQGEVLITPLQIVRIMAVFANGGDLVTPYIVQKIADKDITRYQQRIIDLSLHKSTIQAIKEGLRRVITDPGGTGNVLSDLAISIAGKTGTAQAPPGSAHSWFSGFFPYEKPKYVICVFLERGGPGYNACVLAKQIIETLFEEGLI